MITGDFDTVVVGGGIMGCTVALHLANAGQRVAVFERGGLCMQASGVNAGTLSIQTKPPYLVPYALRGLELWRNAGAWLGGAAGFHQLGGICAAFTDADAALLEQNADARRRAGAPVEIISARRARSLEPGLSEKVMLASWCALDSYANSYQIGDLFRQAMQRSGASVNEFCPIERIYCEDHGYRLVGASGTRRCTRIVLACGLWMEQFLRRDFAIDMPIRRLINQLCVTERMPPVIGSVLGVSGNLLTLKQSQNGTVLIGGGWLAQPDSATASYRIIPENLIGNLRLAHALIPQLSSARLTRTWIGVDGSVDDMLPLLGNLPGFNDAYVIGCVRGGGFTMGPYLGWLLAQKILGGEPEMPLFDPARAVVGDGDPVLQ